jgi:hypothetical protein
MIPMWEGPLCPDSPIARELESGHKSPSHILRKRRYSRSTAAAMSAIVTSVATHAEPIAGVTTKRTS